MNLNEWTAEPIEGWEERTKELAKPELWVVAIHPMYELRQKFTPEEWERMLPKITMVEEFVKYMMAGMVKGTVKYSGDTWTTERWMAHLISEGADQANYQILLLDRWLKDKKDEEDALKRAKMAWEDK